MRWFRSGTGPENSLLSRCNSERNRRFFKDSGMFPENLLLESHSFFNEANLEKKSGGMGPENWFLVRKMDLRAPSLLNSGMGPEKELLTRLMLRRVGICMRASTSILPESPMSVR